MVASESQSQDLDMGLLDPQMSLYIIVLNSKGILRWEMLVYRMVLFKM